MPPTSAPFPLPTTIRRVPEDDWLPDEPPPILARLTGWLIILLFVGVAIGAAVVRFPETIRCRFRLVPETGADPLQSPVNGVLLRVPVVDGSEVGPGAVLFEISSEELRTWQAELQSTEVELRAAAERAKRSEEVHVALAQIKESELQQLRQEAQFRRKYLETTQDLLRRSQEMQVKGLVSAVAELRGELEVASAQKELNTSESGIQKLLLEKSQLQTERVRQRSDELAIAEKLNNMVRTLMLRLTNSVGGVLSVRSPYRATVISVPQRNVGSVVKAGQELCQLARLEDRPVAELQLVQEGLDRVKQGRTVKLFFDAFPYERYGTLDSTLDWVSPTAVSHGEKWQFSARALLKKSSFSNRGQTLEVRAGMMGEARIRVDSRTLLESVFEPLRALREHTR